MRLRIFCQQCGLILVAAFMLNACGGGDSSSGGSGASIQFEKPATDDTVMAGSGGEAVVSVSGAESGTVELLAEDEVLGVRPVSDLDENGETTFSNLNLTSFDGTEQQTNLNARLRSEAGDVRDQAQRQVLVDSLKSQLEQLASDSSDPIRWDADERGVTRLEMRVPVTGATPVAKALDFIEQWSMLFGGEINGNNLALEKIHTTPEELVEVRLVQRVGAFPVSGSALVVTLEGDEAVHFTGNYVPSLPQSPVAEFDAAAAEQTARDDFNAQNMSVVGYTRRVIVDNGLFKPGEPSTPRLAWRVAIQGHVVNEGKTLSGRLAYVDAQTNEVIRRTGMRREAIKDLRIRVMNARGKGQLERGCLTKFLAKSKPACFQNINFRSNGCNSNADSDGDAANARLFAIDMHNYLDSHFSWITNNEGGIIKPFVNVGSGVPNAQHLGGFWCNKQMHFNNTWVVDDILYHEFGHRLVDQTGTDLEYEFQSGAVNEHVADVLAALVEGEKNGSNFDHKIGEDVPNKTQPVRNMNEPTHIVDDKGNPKQPDHMENFFSANKATEDNDHGGVHYNSGILNKASSLIALGGTHGGAHPMYSGTSNPNRSYTVQALGAAKLRELTWKTLESSHTHKTTDFNGWASEMVVQAARTYSPYADNACQVRNAYAAVGILDGDVDCDGTLDAGDADQDGDGIGDNADNCERAYNPRQKDADGDGTGNACSNDDDADGLADDKDNCPTAANPGQTDTNNNGTGDACEDLDGDGLNGINDNCPTTANRNQDDLDGDGKGNACDSDADGDGLYASDNCPLEANPGQADQDGDSRGDVCDDSDGDGIHDDRDACPNTADPNNPDRDNDGRVDACQDDDDDNDGVLDVVDNCQYTKNVEQTDGDADGVGDACDNCPAVVNGDQKDTDSDALGNVCDNDDDSDGVNDGADNCPLTANNRQIDTDGDGSGNSCDDSPFPDWMYEHDNPSSFFAEIMAAKELAENDFTGNRFGIDVCKRAICRDRGYLAEGYTTTLDISAGYRFEAVILDDTGSVIARLEPEQLTLNDSTGEYEGAVSFEPAQDAFYKAENTPGGSFRGSAYHVRMFGDPEYAGVEDTEAVIQVTESIEP